MTFLSPNTINILRIARFSIFTSRHKTTETETRYSRGCNSISAIEPAVSFYKRFLKCPCTTQSGRGANNKSLFTEKLYSKIVYQPSYFSSLTVRYQLHGLVLPFRY